MAFADCPITDVYTILFLAKMMPEVVWMRWFAGMKRRRSKFGEWLDEKGISQSEFSLRSGVNQGTVNGLATGDVQKPTRLNARKLMKAIREIENDLELRDFWDV